MSMFSIFKGVLDLIVPEKTGILNQVPSLEKILNGKIIILYKNNQEIIKEIKNAKLGGQWSIAVYFGEILAKNIKNNKFPAFSNLDFITFVPGDPIRAKTRGYHVPQIIAKTTAGDLEIPFLDLFFKNKHTKTQTSMGKDERLENLKDVFSVNKNALEKIILKKQNQKQNQKIKLLIIDDVTTTGATLLELEKTIKKAVFSLENKVQLEIILFAITGQD